MITPDNYWKAICGNLRTISPNYWLYYYCMIRLLRTIICLMPFSVFAQTGDIGVFVYTEENGKKFSCEFFAEDSLYGTYELDENAYVLVEDLPVGKYDVKLYYKKDLVITRYNVNVIEDLTGELNMDAEVWFYEYDEYVEPVDDYTYDFQNDYYYYDDWYGGGYGGKFEATVSMAGGSGTTGTPGHPVQSRFHFGEMFGGYPWVSKHASVGFFGGMEVGASYFDRDSTVYPFPGPDLIEKERYFYWNINFTTLIRLSAYDNREWYNLFAGPALDFGVRYRAPIMFRYIAISDNTKHNTKWIHNYADLSAIVRFGIPPFMFTAEYQLFDYVKEAGLPQQPIWRFGLDIVVGD